MVSVPLLGVARAFLGLESGIKIKCVVCCGKKIGCFDFRVWRTCGGAAIRYFVTVQFHMTSTPPKAMAQ